MNKKKFESKWINKNRIKQVIASPSIDVSRAEGNHSNPKRLLNVIGGLKVKGRRRRMRLNHAHRRLLSHWPRWFADAGSCCCTDHFFLCSVKRLHLIGCALSVTITRRPSDQWAASANQLLAISHPGSLGLLS